MPYRSSLCDLAVRPPGGGVTLVGGEADALGIDFTCPKRDIQMVVADSGTPGNNGAFDPYSKLTYTSPSLKMCRQSDGVWRYGNHNLILQSQTFDNASWTKNGSTTVSADALNAPDGTATADRINYNNGSVRNSGVTVVTGGTYLVSVFAKFNSGAWIRLAAGDNTSFSNGARVWFDIQNGSVGTSGTAGSGWSVVSGTASITSAGNGWYRCAFVVTTNFTDLVLFIAASSADNTADNPVATVELWGAQAKRYPANDSGGYTLATGYIATTTAAKYDLPYEWDASNASLGILIEEQRTNLCLRSQEMGTTWGTFHTSVSSDATTAPDGTSTADKIVEAADSNFHTLSQTTTIGAGSTDTVSCFFKAAGRTKVELGGFDGTFANGFAALADLSGVSVSTSTTGGGTVAGATITDAGSGWYRVTVTGVVGGGSTSLIINIALHNGTSTNYAGDGSSGVYAWGAQVEQAAFPTSPIHTIGATVTRAGDKITFPTSGFPYQDSGSTLVAAYRIPFTPSLGGQKTLFDVNNGTAERIHMKGTRSASLLAEIYIRDGGVDQTDDQTSGNVSANATMKMAMAYATNDVAAVLNGGSVLTDGSATMPTPVIIEFGISVNDDAQLNGYLQQVTYLKRRATNGELQTRTT